MKLIKIIIAITSIGFLFIGVKLYHNNKFDNISNESQKIAQKHQIYFQQDYDSIVSLLYNNDAEQAVKFESLFDKSLIFRFKDSIISTFVFSDKVLLSIYQKHLFQYFIDISRIDVENDRNILNLKESIINISAEFNELGEKWSEKILNENSKIERFISKNDFEHEGIDNSYFDRQKIRIKDNSLYEYRNLLEFAVLKNKEQDSINLDQSYDLIYEFVYANNKLNESNFNELLKFYDTLKIDSTIMNHKFRSNVIGDFEIQTYNKNFYLKEIKDMIDSLYNLQDLYNRFPNLSPDRSFEGF